MTLKTKEIEIRIYFSDTDAVGVVYHANYLDFAERARVELLRDCGFDITKLAEEKIFFVIRKADIDYFAPAVLDDLIRVKAFVSNMGKTSIELTQEIFNVATGALICTVKCLAVCVDMSSGKPVPKIIPEQLRNSFSN